MKTKIVCDAERVQDYLRLKAQYDRRIKAAKEKVQAAENELQRAKTGLGGIQGAFIADAVDYPGNPFEGVFPDGEGGFVHVTAQLSNHIHGSKNILTIEKVIQ